MEKIMRSNLLSVRESSHVIIKKTNNKVKFNKAYNTIAIQSNVAFFTFLKLI